MDKKFYVYGLFDPNKNDPYYIGKGKDGRCSSHFEPNRLKREKKYLKTKISIKIINEGGFPIYKILFNNLTENEAFLKERELISKYGRIDNGTGCLANHTDGGEGLSGIIIPLDSIIKRSESLKGVPRPLDVRKKISKTLKGRKRPKETLKKISKAKAGKIYPKLIKANKKNALKRKGVPLKKETKLKISRSQKGRTVPLERRIKISNTLKKTYILYDPHGQKLTITDISKFCQQNNFSKNAKNCLAALANKGFYLFKNKNNIYKYTSYKGYTSTIT